MNKEKLTKGFILGTMIGLYIIVSIISTFHVITFFEMSNPRWLAISLAVAFEIGAAASLASIIALDKTNKTLIWTLFILLTTMQIQGNMFYAYTNLENFNEWIELFGLHEEELITQKRILSIVSGAILPVIALGFIKSLIDYITINKFDAHISKPLVNTSESDIIKKETKSDSNVVDTTVNSTEYPADSESEKADHLTSAPIATAPTKAYNPKP
jgi:hypothetical protein